MQTVISKFNTIITKEYLQKQQENQYFERKGLGEKEIKPTKIAEELDVAPLTRPLTSFL